MSSYGHFGLPAGSIRLVKLKPSEDHHSPIECELFNYKLPDHGYSHPYEALSYAWEDGCRDQPISIKGREMLITMALRKALMFLRDPSMERVMWIDAICLDQDNLDEKTQAVANISKIFAYASRVIIWLGHDSVHTNLALETLYLAATGKQSMIEQMQTPLPDQTEEFSRRRKAVLSILCQPWFERIWVLQEVAAARHITINCFGEEIEANLFCDALATLKLSYEEWPKLQPVVNSVTQLMKTSLLQPPYISMQHGESSLGTRPLSELVEMYHNRKATKRHDKIYALLGMSSDSVGKAEIVADYTISWGQLLRKYLQAVLSRESDIETREDEEIAIIRGHATILGEVSSIENDSAQEDRQCVSIVWRAGISELASVGEKRTSCWSLVVSAKAIKKGDFVCLLEGASQPTIIRPFHDDHAVVVMMVVTPPHDEEQSTEGIKWPELLKSISNFPELLVLVWDWDEYPNPSGGSTKYKSLLQVWDQGPLKIKWGEYMEDINEIQQMLDQVKLLQEKDGIPQDPLLEMERVLVHMRRLDRVAWAKGRLTELQKKVEVMLETLLSQFKNMPLLAWAAQESCTHTFKALLDTKKLDINAEDDLHMTALSWTATTGNKQIAHWLLQSPGVRLDALDHLKRTLLVIAAQNGQAEVFKLLLDTGKVDPAAKDGGGRTPLQAAAHNGRVELAKLILDTGKVDLATKDGGGRTPLSRAAEFGYDEVVKLLLSSREDGQDISDKDGKTPLCWAVQKENVDVAKLMLDTGKFHPDTKDRQGRTPWSWAAQNGNIEMVKLLLGTGKVDADSKGKGGRTPTSWAAGCGHHDIAQLLLRSHGTKPDTKDRRGRTPLSWAAQGGHWYLVALLTTGTAPCSDAPDSEGRTPLSWAAENGHDNIVSLLLNGRGVVPDSRDHKGRTPMSWAAGNGHAEVVRLLLKVDNTSVVKPDLIGWTPRRWAQMHGHKEVVKVLTPEGAAY